MKFLFNGCVFAFRVEKHTDGSACEQNKDFFNLKHFCISIFGVNIELFVGSYFTDDLLLLLDIKCWLMWIHLKIYLIDEIIMRMNDLYRKIIDGKLLR